MARTSPLTFTRPNAVEESRTFTDPNQPDSPIELYLRVVADGNVDGAIIDKAAELLQKYVNGDGEWQRSEGKTGTPPVQMPYPGTSEFIPVTGRQASTIAHLMVYEASGVKSAQAAGKVPDDWKPYSPEEWFVLAGNAATAWDEIELWLADMLGRARGLGKNVLTGETDS